METPEPVDVAAWPRRQHWEHYRTVPCTYAMTVEMDVTDFVAAVRATGRRAYLAQIWAIASVVNRHEEFRMAQTEAGEPAVWARSHPSFTVFHAERETFSSLWAPYDEDFDVFHGAAAQVSAEHAGSEDFFPQGPPPPNSFDISSLPWTDFTGFTLDIEGGRTHLAPIFTMGRYAERDGRIIMPLAVQVNHAAADGFHTARLVNELKELFAAPSWLQAS